mmetsp:Transcript_5773/g.10819  ORF Transcript_5773/g.10819 Transcript_5773/m.10819 type:complete len:215 (+) Transcript_5773:192-836(+)|eukprot:CAMPEP_0184554502 /NCGR_PEP_ID=MMETSP0199_2-20130426/35183_1 /TAXON_ID=1112570 /ORGANISM="Thraustochytrium sp., Strain LLF1b" /LENGTH=214 /DNA_ID=CAMNT_0026950573 /DNA_START=116 /DNA_END=760 /DNA_ORIENTATION=+
MLRRLGVTQAAKRVWTGYSRALSTQPVLTKTTTGVVIYSCGDVVMQKMERDSLKEDANVTEGKEAASSWDSYRTLRMCTYGGLWLGPFLHVWYRGLEQLFVGRAGPLVMVGKLLLDQSMAAPANMVAFYVIQGKMQNHSWLEVSNVLQERLWPTMCSLWTLWVPVQFINLTFVPLDKRVLVVNIVGVAWSMIMSKFGSQVKAAPIQMDVVDWDA